MILTKQEDCLSGEKQDCGSASSPATSCNVNKNESNRNKRHKNIDRFTLADVTLDYCIPSPGSRSKGKGRRRLHRMENVKYLLSFWNKNDEECDPSEECDFSETPFSRIVSDDNLRKIWNTFSELNGEQQDQYITFLENGLVTKASNPSLPKCDNSKSENIAAQTNDCANEHADRCYHRIGKRLRNALKKKHVPLGLLEGLESDVIKFFDKWPKSKYSSVLSSSYERLLMHALCQYLGLMSKSVTQSGNRFTEVQTKKDEVFHIPNITLSQYIKERI